MKKNKVFRMLIEQSILSLDRPREYFAEGSFVLNSQIVETRFKVLLRLYKVFNLRPTKELAKNIDNYVSIIAISGFSIDNQVIGAFWGIVFAQYMNLLPMDGATFEKKSIESIDDLEHFSESLDGMYAKYSESQRKEMLASLKKFSELFSPSSCSELSPRIYTFDERISLPASCAALYWAEKKEEENKDAN